MAMEQLKVNTLVELKGGNKGLIKSWNFENGEYIYDVEIENDISLQYHRNELQIISSSEKQTTSRFVSLGDNDVDEFVDDHENKNTLKKTVCNLNLLKTFFISQNESRSIESIPPLRLNELLCKFFLSVRKPNGENYEPNSLKGFMGSFDRQLRRKNYGLQISTSLEFTKV